MERSPYMRINVDDDRLEVEETKRWVDRKLAEIRAQEADIEMNKRADEIERLHSFIPTPSPSVTPSKSITKTPSSSVSPGIPKKIYECKNGSCTYVATVMAPDDIGGYVPSLAEQHSSPKQERRGGWDFTGSDSTPSEKPVDTNYTGKSVLSYLLQLDFDLLIQVVETVQWKKVLFQVAFSLRDAVNKVLEFTSHEWKMRDILINKANLPPKETPSQPLFYEEDIVTPIIK